LAKRHAHAVGTAHVEFPRSGQRLAPDGRLGRKRFGATAHDDLPTAALPASGSRGLRPRSPPDSQPSAPRPQSGLPRFPPSVYSVGRDAVGPPGGIRMRGLMRRKSDQRELPSETPSPPPSVPAARAPEPTASTVPGSQPASATARLLEELAAACAAAPLEEKI